MNENELDLALRRKKIMNKSDAVAIIRSLLSSTNSSYSIGHLNKDFKKETGIDIPLFGYGNISDFLNSIPDTVTMTGVYPIQRISLVANDRSAHIVSLVKRQKKNSQRNKSFPKAKSSSRERAHPSFGTKEPKESKMVYKKGVSHESKDKLYQSPSDMYIYLETLSWMGERIPTINLRLHAQVGEYVEVCPCWIFSPDKFYFHFRKFKKKFVDFTKKLQMFYSAHKEIPNMVGGTVKPRQPCAVFHKIFSESKWHRAEIVEINKSSQVIVNFVDYGNSAEISKENVKYLHENFQSFPRQAVLGSLANIKPSKGCSKWSRGSIQRFHDLAFEKDLIGGVVNMDNKSGGVEMALSWTRGPEIHINDALVKEGYAEFEINVLKCDFGEVTNKTRFCKTSLNACTNENIQAPAFFFTSDHCSNIRLRRMFSSGAGK